MISFSNPVDTFAVSKDFIFAGLSSLEGDVSNLKYDYLFSIYIIITLINYTLL